MLSELRVLELSAPETMLAGQALGDLGADVIVVEPPAGAPGRRLEPFVDGVPGLERSLTWLALNRNKRAITLATDTPDGRALLGELAARCDVLLEGVSPGAEPMAIATHPRLIRCILRPFAASGPKSDYAASDLILMAASGSLAMSGDADRPPVPFPVPQAMMESAADALVGILAAVAARDASGEGQIVDVSGRVAALAAGFGQPIVIPSGNREPGRSGGAATVAGVRVPEVFACKDGFVVVSVLAGFVPAFAPLAQALARWLVDEGAAPEAVAEIDWATFPIQLATGKAEAARLRDVVEGVTAVCRMRTKQELFEVARERGLLIAPAMDMADIHASPHHRERGLWTEIELPSEERRVPVPSRFAQLSSFRIEARRPPPRLSEHTFEVLTEELGLSLAEVQTLFIHGFV